MRVVLVLVLGCEPLDGAPAAAVADQCASCHAAEAEDHALSKHALADSSPVFLALRARADTPLCDSCHRKIGCIDCHTAVGNESVSNGLMLWDRDGPVRGPTGIAIGAPHATERSEYLESSDLCGTCHEVRGPAGFSESPFTHWLSSPAAQRNVGCKDCHATHRRSVPYGEGVKLSLSEGVLTIDHSNGGHHFPDGASFLRDVEIVADEQRIPLGAQLLRGEETVALPTEADRIELRGVEAGSVRIETSEAEEVCISVRLRSDLLDALQLQVDNPMQTFGCVSR